MKTPLHYMRNYTNISATPASFCIKLIQSRRQNFKNLETKRLKAT